MSFQCRNIGPQCWKQEREKIFFTQNFGGNGTVPPHDLLHEFRIRQITKWRLRVRDVGRPPGRYYQIMWQPSSSSGKLSRHFGGQYGSHAVSEEHKRDFKMW